MNSSFLSIEVCQTKPTIHTSWHDSLWRVCRVWKAAHLISLAQTNIFHYSCDVFSPGVILGKKGGIRLGEGKAVIALDVVKTYSIFSPWQDSRVKILNSKVSMCRQGAQRLACMWAHTCRLSDSLRAVCVYQILIQIFAMSYQNTFYLFIKIFSLTNVTWLDSPPDKKKSNFSPHDFNSSSFGCT